MSISKTTNTYNRLNWESSEFPIICQTCLGDNPYIRMLKEKFGKECKICSRPFTVFKWCPGARMRYKKTEICQTCSKLKNVCQTCLLDMEYGLPVQVRDSALKQKESIPKSEINKEYFLQNIEQSQQLEKVDNLSHDSSKYKQGTSNDVLLKLARTTPYYKRNRPHICSFWVKGECNRGEECPYRHELPTDPNDPLSIQNIKDRYYGQDDPVADKLLSRYNKMPKIEPPDDKSVTSLYIGGLDEAIKESDLKDHFYQFGEITSVTIIRSQNFGFVSFSSRESAERAADMTSNNLIINDRKLKVLWGKGQGQNNSNSNSSNSKSTRGHVPGIPGILPPPPSSVFLQASAPPQYPSQIPKYGIPSLTSLLQVPDQNESYVPASLPENPTTTQSSSYSNIHMSQTPPFLSQPQTSIPPYSSYPHHQSHGDQGRAIRSNYLNQYHYPSQDPQRMGAGKQMHS